MLYTHLKFCKVLIIYCSDFSDYFRIESQIRFQNCQVVIREPYRDGRNSTWTGTGFMKALEGSVLNFTIDDIRRSMWYDVIVRYEPVHPGVWEDVQVILERDSLPDPNGPCADWKPEYDRLWVQLPLRSRSAVAQPSVCLEAGKRYNLLLQFHKFNSHVDTPLASILVDSVIYNILFQFQLCRQLSEKVIPS